MNADHEILYGTQCVPNPYEFDADEVADMDEFNQEDAIDLLKESAELRMLCKALLNADDYEIQCMARILKINAMQIRNDLVRGK